MFEEVVRCSGLDSGCYAWSPLDYSIYGKADRMYIPEDWEFIDKYTHYCPRCLEKRKGDSQCLK